MEFFHNVFASLEYNEMGRISDELKKLDKHSQDIIKLKRTIHKRQADMLGWAKTVCTKGVSEASQSTFLKGIINAGELIEKETSSVSNKVVEVTVMCNRVKKMLTDPKIVQTEKGWSDKDLVRAENVVSNYEKNVKTYKKNLEWPGA